MAVSNTTVDRRYIVDGMQGSVFVIDMAQQNIKPLALQCLDRPTGMAYGQTEQLFYVCETGKNRVLRFFENTDGVVYPR